MGCYVSLPPPSVPLAGEADAVGAATASFWVAWRHLWLSQSTLQQADHDCLLRLPVDPTAMFGPDVRLPLQEAQESRGCAQAVSAARCLMLEAAFCFVQDRASDP